MLGVAGYMGVWGQFSMHTPLLATLDLAHRYARGDAGAGHKGTGARDGFG